MATSTEIGGLLARIAPAPAERSGLASSRNLSRWIPLTRRRFRSLTWQRRALAVRSVRSSELIEAVGRQSTNETVGLGKKRESSSPQRKTKIVCTIGPSTSSREMVWKLAESGMNVARLNMSHGDHNSHQKTINFVKEYNAQSKDNVIAIMLDTKGPEVRCGDVPQPILLKEGQEFNFTIKRGVSTENSVSVNYDDFVNDVDAGDILLVDGGMVSLVVRSKTADTVKCEVIDVGELKSRRHLNVRGRSATLPSITGKGWEDIKFGVDNNIDFYAVSFVKDAQVVHELKDYLRSCNADIGVIVKLKAQILYQIFIP